MAQPNLQTGLSNAAGTAVQPQIAQRQAPIGEKTLNPQVAVQRTVQAPPRPAPSPAPVKVEEERANSDWGLEPTKPAFSRENKFILFVLFVLVAVFSFVVYRNFQKKQAGPQSEVTAKDKKPDAKDAKKTAKSESANPGTPPDQGGGDLVAENQGEEAVTLADNPPGQDPFGAEETPRQAATNATEDPAQTFANETGEMSRTNAELPGQEGDVEILGGTGAADTAAVDAGGLETEVTGNQSTEVGSTEATTLNANVFESGAAEVATEAPPARRGRGSHSKPAAPPQDFASPIEVVDTPVDSTAFETAGDTELTTEVTQTGGGTGVRTGRQRPQGGATQLEVAQSTTTQDTLTPPTDVAQPIPGINASKTGTRTATRPRGTNLPPPPLDPNDPKLGGYREADTLSDNTSARTRGRGPAAAPARQFDPQSEPLVVNAGDYIVRPNDNFWRISRKVYGSARYFAALAKHNEAIVIDSKQMRPGIKISTPSKEQLEQTYGNLIPAAAPVHPPGAMINPPHAPKTPGFFVEPDGQPAYRVGSTDTLSSISQKTLGRSSRWDEIYELNRDRIANADALPVGAIVRLPLDASQTRVVGKPVENR